MKYFSDITNLEQAKLHYRFLAKQLHPDKGGSATEFQKMQQEYKALLLQLQQSRKVVTSKNQSDEHELLNELGKLAKVLIKKQVSQNYLQHQITKSQSPITQKFCSGIISFCDRLAE